MSQREKSRLLKEVRTWGLEPVPADPRPVTLADLEGLPAPAQRYLHFAGVVGRPRDWSFLARFDGRFRMGPGRRWMACEAWQYNTAWPVARIYRLVLRPRGLPALVGLDTYSGGRGRMQGRLAGLVPVAGGSGREFDLGELVTWLNDALLVAPSMLLPPAAEWSPIDERSFQVSLTDGPNTVTATVSVDRHGRLVDFSSRDRWYAAAGGPPVRAEWHTPVRGWATANGRALPVNGAAVWHLDGGPFAYAEGHWMPASVEYNVEPGAPLRRGGLYSRGNPAAEGARGAAEIGLALLLAPLRHKAYDRWGATPEETRAAMPGDELVPFPNLTSTRAVTIDAGPDRVWPWLVQIGQGRGGFYSFDALENLIGCGIHSAGRVVREWQHLKPGDLVLLAPGQAPCFRVAAADPPRSLVLAGADPRTRQVGAVPSGPGQAASTWQWTLEPLDGGRRTRLVARQRYSYPRRQAPLWRLLQPVDFVMEREMLRGIKARAEGRRPAGARTAQRAA